jgi:hypothetical protein
MSCDLGSGVKQHWHLLRSTHEGSQQIRRDSSTYPEKNNMWISIGKISVTSNYKLSILYLQVEQKNLKIDPSNNPHGGFTD